MEKYKRYYGIMIFLAAAFLLIFGSYKVINPKIDTLNTATSDVDKKEALLKTKKEEMTIVKNKIKKIHDSIINSQKKVYSPIESGLENDTIFFTLYNDIIEMIHADSVKIKSLDYSYNPKTDKFVKFGNDIYLVCDINMELVSNYVNLGKLIQDLYQYPYYIKINELSIKPYEKDKKVLISNLSLRLYAHTSPEEDSDDTASADILVPEVQQ